MQDVKYFRCEIENGKTYISARSQPQYVLGPNGWVDLHADYGEGMGTLGLDVNAKATANVVAFAEEPADLVSTYGSQKGLHADIILEAEVGLEDIDVYGRNEAIQAAEVEAGLKQELLREMVWVEGAEDIPGVIVLPQDDYKRVYVLEGSRDNPTVRFVPEKNEAGGVRPYYEKPGDGKTYIYVDGFSGGSGTQEDPYLIHNVHELQAMKNNLNAHYALAQDIDASETVNWNDGAGFEPIGTNASRFRGSFDGRGHKITGLHINRGSWNRVGLFGVADDATIQNVGLVDETFVGLNYVGGVVGQVYSGSVTQCYNTGSVTGGSPTGGVVGYLDTSAIMRECYNTGSVTGIENTGGVVGHNVGSVTQCYNTGSVTGEADTGGVVGYNNGSVTQCYWNTETSGVSTGVGRGLASGVFGRTTAQMMQQATYVDWDFDEVWFINEGNDYPRFQWEGPPGPIEKELRAPGIVMVLRVVGLVAPGIVQTDVNIDRVAPGVVRGGIETVLDAPVQMEVRIRRRARAPFVVNPKIRRIRRWPLEIEALFWRRVPKPPGVFGGD